MDQEKSYTEAHQQFANEWMALGKIVAAAARHPEAVRLAAETEQDRQKINYLHVGQRKIDLDTDVVVEEIKLYMQELGQFMDDFVKPQVRAAGDLSRVFAASAGQETSLAEKLFNYSKKTNSFAFKFATYAYDLAHGHWLTKHSKAQIRGVDMANRFLTQSLQDMHNGTSVKDIIGSLQAAKEDDDFVDVTTAPAP